jgi:hypothetical protein
MALAIQDLQFRIQIVGFQNPFNLSFAITNDEQL